MIVYGHMGDKEWKKSSSFGESCRHALDGVSRILREERNLKILIGFFVAAILLAFWLKLSAVEYAIIILTSASIFAAELFNAALEAIEDLVWPEYREAVKASKDMAAGAVLVLSSAAVVIGLLIFLPSLIELI